MKVVHHALFHRVYTSDPAARAGRIEAVEQALAGKVTFVEPEPASKEDILRLHREEHLYSVEREGLYDIAALAAGGAIAASEIALSEPAFALIRPPGHHASANRSWGFCYFNNMAIALEKLKWEGKIEKAFILDFDLHFGDGTANLLDGKGYITLLNPVSSDRHSYLEEVEEALAHTDAEMIAASAGFDHHEDDWGGLLKTEDYALMGLWMGEAARRNNGGCFGILEGGYNHAVLGENVLAFVEGLSGKVKG